MIEQIHIEIIYAEPNTVWRQTLEIKQGSCIADAMAKFDAAQFPEHLDPHKMVLAVFGQLVKSSDLLHNFDRIEILRLLQCDPKDNRRLRAQLNPLKIAKRGKNKPRE